MTDLSQRIASLSPKKRALLAQQLQQKAELQAKEPTIPQQPEADNYPLSFAQQQLWFLDQFEPNSPLYNTPIAIRMEGSIEFEYLEAALNEIMRRHQVLRTVFPAQEGKPVQVVQPFQPAPLTIEDISALPYAEREPYAQRLLIEKAQEPFHLAHDRMMRTLLIRLSEQEHILLVIIHHIVIDGWSIGILKREIIALYQDFRFHRPVSLPRLPLQYTDFAYWQLQRLQGEALEEQLSYWRTTLSGDLPVITMPTTRPRSSMPVFRGMRYEFMLPATLRAQLHTVSQRYGMTLFMTLLAGLSTLLYRYSGQDDILIGTPIANRTYTELEDLIGYFANTLLLRVDLSDNPRVDQLFKRVQEVTLGAYAHQDLPLEKIISELHSERNLSGTPLLQIMFVLQNAPFDRVEIPDLKLTSQAVDNGTAKFDLTFSFADVEGELAGAVEYNTELFDTAMIARMVLHFQHLLTSLATQTELTVAELPLLLPTERQAMLVEWNNTEAVYPDDQCLHQLFEQQVQMHLAQVAIICGAEQLTYKELNERANQLAHLLCEHGIGPDSIVGICLERSATLVVGLLAILKAGGAYVSLDANYPQERLAFMLEDSQISVLITHEDLLSRLPEHLATVICVDRDYAAIQQQLTTNPISGVGPDHLVYMIYTSGSTGKPKGVLLNHRGRVNNFNDFNQRFHVSSNDRLLSISSPSFDMLAYDVFGILAAGATIVLPEAEAEKNPLHWYELILRHKVTIWHSVPALLELLVDAVLDRDETTVLPLRLALLGGDWIPVSLPERLRKLVNELQFISLGGATEASMDSTIYHVNEVDPAWKSIPYGRPMANQRCYILDSHLQPVPIGVPGELHLAGFGLARGYLHAPEITDKKFIPNPLLEEPGARLYKTGDLARYLPDGTIELLGRIDFQVKIGGVRIELGEIESVLSQHPQLQTALVTARTDVHGHKQLIAYIVLQPDATVDLVQIRNFVQERLPEAMIPAAFIILDALPLTPNGKVDRRNLPDTGQLDTKPTRGYVAPRTPVEQLLTEIWAQVLHVERVGIHDNFFASGGDSILSIQAIARANNRSIQITPKQLFQHQTIAELATVATAMHETTHDALPLSAHQQNLVGQAHQQIVFLELTPSYNAEKLHLIIKHLLRQYDALRLTFFQRDGVWYQKDDVPAEDAAWHLVDLAVLPVEEHEDVIDATLRELINREDGERAFNAVLFAQGPLQPDRLALVSNMLAIDSGFFTLLQEEFKSVYDRLFYEQGEVEDIYPVSSQQQMMLHYSNAMPGSGIYIIHVNYVMNMDFNLSALEQAWQTIIQRYPVLRSTFAWEGLKLPLQIVHRDMKMPIEQLDWRELTLDEQQHHLDALLQEDKQRGYDLSQLPIMKLFIIRLTDETCEYIWSNHHILLDGWSRSSIQKEIFILYSQLCQGQVIELSYTRPFKDYITWLYQQDHKPAEAFWHQYLQGFKKPTPLIANKGQSCANTSFAKQKIQLSVELTNALQGLSRQSFLTMNTLVQGAWLLLLSRYTGEQDIVLGVTSSARPASFSGIETVVGLLSNTIPLRQHLPLGTPLLTWLKDLQTQLVELRQYEYQPWQQVQAYSEISPERFLFESYLVFENYPWDFGGLNLSVDASHPLAQKDYTIAQTEFPLRLDAVPGPSLILAMSYYHRYFDDLTIAHMLADWLAILEHFSQHPQRTLSDLIAEPFDLSLTTP
jgi:amino acid adenylation domain-containing protein